MKRGVCQCGDVPCGHRSYRALQVRLQKLADVASVYGELSWFQKLASSDPNTLTYSLQVEVPLDRPLKDEAGRPVSSLVQFAGPADINGLLQFADRAEDAPVIHFNGPWEIWPREGTKFVLGRPEEFTTVIGTPGRGAGTLACIVYHTLDEQRAMFVPKAARPLLEASFSDRDGRPVVERCVLEHRC